MQAIEAAWKDIHDQSFRYLAEREQEQMILRAQYLFGVIKASEGRWMKIIRNRDLYTDLFGTMPESRAIAYLKMLAVRPFNQSEALSTTYARVEKALALNDLWMPSTP